MELTEGMKSNSSFLLNESPMLTALQIEQVHQVATNLIDSLDEYALNELFSGSALDVSNITKAILFETQNALFNPKTPLKTTSFDYLDKLTTQLDKQLKKESFNYFILTVLPQFDMGLHHVEWGNMTQFYRWLAILAARDHSKSYTFSFAYPLWKLYQYEREGFRTSSKKNTLSKKGMIITDESTLASLFLKDIRETITENPILREKLYPGNAGTWGETMIICKNGAELQVKGSNSGLRGRHPGWIIVDDLLNESHLYSEKIRKQSIDFFHSVIMNLLVPGGDIKVVGCVVANTLVLEKNLGFCNIIDLAPKGIDLEKKGLYESENLLSDSFNNFELSEKFFVNGFVDTRKITLQNSLEVEGSYIHPLWKFNKEDGTQDWCQLKDIKVGDIVEIKNTEEVEDWGEEQLISYTNEIKYCTPINLPQYMNEEIAYMLGLYVAEGNCHKNRKQVQITNQEIDLSFLQKYGLNFISQDTCHKVVSSKIFYNWIEELGLNKKAFQKKIPDIILRGKKKYMTSFISGYFDGDGSAERGVSCGSANPELIKQLQHILIMGYGINSFIHIAKKEDVNRNFIEKGSLVRANHDFYSLNLSPYGSKLFFEKIGFKIKRKQDKNIAFERTRLDLTLPTPVELLRVIKKQSNENKVKYTIIPEQILKRKGELTIRRLQEIYEYYKQFFISKELEGLKNYYNKNWSSIVKIEESQNYTYDFVIPKHNIFIGNGIKQHQTPFSAGDLYSNLKKAPGWRVFEYPAILPDGSLLFPERHTLKALLAKRAAQGSMVFSREILVKPISSDSTIFPYPVLERAFIGMGDISLSENRFSFKKKFKKVVIGCDFAISANVSADYVVFTVLGLDELDCLWLIHQYRGKGVSHNQQIAILKKLNSDFQPDVIMMEDNAFQKVMLQLATEAGLKVTPHTTTTNKYDLKAGLPALAVLFERNQFRFPRGDQNSRDISDSICMEASSITWAESGKFETTAQHDDQVYSLWIAARAAFYVNESFTFTFF